MPVMKKYFAKSRSALKFLVVSIAFVPVLANLLFFQHGHSLSTLDWFLTVIFLVNAILFFCLFCVLTLMPLVVNTNESIQLNMGLIRSKTYYIDDVLSISSLDGKMTFFFKNGNNVTHNVKYLSLQDIQLIENITHSRSPSHS
jgi:hypothetical protein